MKVYGGMEVRSTDVNPWKKFRLGNTVVNREFSDLVVTETNSVGQFQTETKVFKLNEKPLFSKCAGK
jgi:hypothetical protein